MAAGRKRKGVVGAEELATDREKRSQVVGAGLLKKKKMRADGLRFSWRRRRGNVDQNRVVVDGKEERRRLLLTMVEGELTGKWSNSRSQELTGREEKTKEG